MTTRTRNLVIGMAVLCLAYPGFAWLIGLQVEASLQKREQQAMDLSPGSVTLISRHYHRGVYGATEDLVYGFGVATQRALAPLAGAPDLTALRLTVRNTIQHGPLPQFRTVALATVTTQVDLPAALSTKVRALLGGAPDNQIHSRLGWLGGVTTVIASAGYQAKLADGSELNWQGLEATLSANASLPACSLDAGMARLAVKSTRLQAEVDGLRMTADWKRAFEVLYTGPFALRITAVKWQSLPDAKSGQIQELSLDGAGSVDGDYYKSAVKLGADKAQESDFSVTHAEYDVSFEHLHGPTLAALMKDRRGTPASAAAGSEPSPVAPAESLQQNAIELLLHEPVVRISQFAFTMPEGALRLSAPASAPGLKREDLDGGQVQQALIQHLGVVADLRIDAALATRLLASSGRQEAMAGQITALEQQGYIKRDGDALTAHLSFAGGKMEVNGLPYPPGRPQ